MRIITKDTNKVFDIELRIWHDGWYAGYEPDCFDDLECNFIRDCCERIGWDCYAKEEDVRDMLSWWESEVASANDDPDYEGDGLNGLQDGEWCLLVDEEDADEDEWYRNVTQGGRVL